MSRVTFLDEVVINNRRVTVEGNPILFNWYAEKWSPENRSQEKCPSKIVLRQKNSKQFKRLFHFYRLIPLHIQKDVWRLHHDLIYAPNCRTLKESRKVCCQVLGFHRLITSEHSTHTPRCSTLTPRFFVSEFPGDRFSGDHFSRGLFFRRPFFGDYFSGIRSIVARGLLKTLAYHSLPKYWMQKIQKSWNKICDN